MYFKIRKGNRKNEKREKRCPFPPCSEVLSQGKTFFCTLADFIRTKMEKTNSAGGLNPWSLLRIFPFFPSFFASSSKGRLQRRLGNGMEWGMINSRKGNLHKKEKMPKREGRKRGTGLFRASQGLTIPPVWMDEWKGHSH